MRATKGERRKEIVRNKLLALCVLGALASQAYGASAPLPRGLDKGVNPATVCLYYSSTNCFPIGAMSAVGAYAATMDTVKVTGNPTLTISPTGNPLSTLAVTNFQGASVSNSQREFLYSFGGDLNTGSTGRHVPSDAKVVVYEGAMCRSRAKACWTNNKVMVLSSPLNANFFGAIDEESDINNNSGNDFHNTYGQIGFFRGYVGNIVLTGASKNQVDFAIDIGGLNTTTKTGMYNRGIQFQAGLGPVLADIQSEDRSQSVLADFGTHTNALDLKGDYSGAEINIKTASPEIALDTRTSGSPRVISGLANGSRRWNMNLGSGAPDDFDVCRFGDDGLVIDCPFGIKRSTGQITAEDGIKGAVGRTSAVAGVIGERVTSSIPAGSAVALTSGTPANVTSVSLTAGDWLCSGEVDFYPAGGTTQTINLGGINTVSATLPTKPAGGSYFEMQNTIGAGLNQSYAVGTVEENVSLMTTVYLVASATFAASTETAGGFLGCTRFR